MPGPRANAQAIAQNIQGYSSTAVTAGQNLTEGVSVVFGRITAVKFYGATAGTGGANTVGDVLVNGTSIWAVAANKPTLLATSTGEFTNSLGDPIRSAVKPGDLITLQVASISSTGQARVAATATIQRV